ncbi:MAG: hypothetical protein LAT83_08680, partial [Kiritimatiellae bacterium]|nr:hypothetical protein [Kiritimatiellia bacterium]
RLGGSWNSPTSRTPRYDRLPLRGKFRVLSAAPSLAGGTDEFAPEEVPMRSNRRLRAVLPFTHKSVWI